MMGGSKESPGISQKSDEELASDCSEDDPLGKANAGEFGDDDRPQEFEEGAPALEEESDDSDSEEEEEEDVDEGCTFGIKKGALTLKTAAAIGNWDRLAEKAKKDQKERWQERKAREKIRLSYLLPPCALVRRCA